MNCHLLWTCSNCNHRLSRPDRSWIMFMGFYGFVFAHNPKQLMHLKLKVQGGHAKCQNEKGELKQTRCEQEILLSVRSSLPHISSLHNLQGLQGWLSFVIVWFQKSLHHWLQEVQSITWILLENHSLICWGIGRYSQIAEVWATMVTWTVLGTVGPWSFFGQSLWTCWIHLDTQVYWMILVYFSEK